MAEKTYAGVSVNVNSEGYFEDHKQWTKEMAAEIAKDLGIELTDEHQKVLDFLRSDFEEKGVIPSMRRMKKTGGIPTKDFYRLFPDGPLKKSCMIAGLPKPASCV